MELSKRLRALVEMIQCDTLADIGCDHAYVACESILEKRARKAYACDVAQGPLNHARRTVSQNHLEDFVICRLQDGVRDLPEDVDTLLIAGMGGQLICSILSELSADHLVETLILSPHKDAPALRLWLQQHQWHIVKERIVEEDGHFYPLILAQKGHGQQPLEQWEIQFGTHVTPEPDAREALHHQLKKWEELLERLPENRKQEMMRSIEQAKIALAHLHT